MFCWRTVQVVGGRNDIALAGPEKGSMIDFQRQSLAPGSIERHACDTVEQDTTGINVGLAGLNMHIP